MEGQKGNLLSTIHSSLVPRPAPRVRDNEDGSDGEGDDATVTRRVKERGQWRQFTDMPTPHQRLQQVHGGCGLA